MVVVRDLDASLRFYRDGIGLDLLQDRTLGATGRICSTRPAAACARSSSATPEFPTTTLVSWSSACLTVTSRLGRRPRRRGPGSSCCRFRRRRGRTEPLAALGLGAPPARHSIDATRADNPGYRARPGRGCLSCSPPVRLPGACNELTARRRVRHRGCHPSPHGANNRAICLHSISLSARMMAVPNRRSARTAPHWCLPDCHRPYVRLPRLAGWRNFARLPLPRDRYWCDPSLFQDRFDRHLTVVLGVACCGLSGTGRLLLPSDGSDPHKQ